jgi:hypothetical protein
MNTTQAGEEELKTPEVLKTDVLGRVKRSAARREPVLDEFERSGLSGQKFAELIGVLVQLRRFLVSAGGHIGSHIV